MSAVPAPMPPCQPASPTARANTASFRATVLPPAGVDLESVSLSILTPHGDSARDITAGPAAIEEGSSLTIPYFDPGPGADLILRFGYPGPAGSAPLVWVTIAQPGQPYELPRAPLSTEPGEALLSLRPSLHGFRFVNHFPGSPIPPAAERLLGVAFDGFGLCGGMSFAAADMFAADRPRPADASPPGAGTPLYNYLYQRQADSLGAFYSLGLRFARWMALPRETLTGTAKRTDDEFRNLRAALDAGRPAVLGLIFHGAGEGEVWQNHQVLAYGYHAPGDGSATIRIYDPNYPGRDDVTIRAKSASLGRIDDPSSPEHPTDIRGLRCRLFLGGHDHRPIRGFFLMPYSPVPPPPEAIPPAR